MELRNCPECGKVFTYIRTNLCPDCQRKDEQEFKAVRKYVLMNPGAHIDQISQETGVSAKKIVHYIREGRLSIKNQDCQIQITCELCGDLISSGRYCKECLEKLSSGLKKSISEENLRTMQELAKDTSSKGTEPKNSNKDRMHTADFWSRGRNRR